MARQPRPLSPSILEVMGLAEQPNFQNYHRVLNRAVWSNLQASKILLTILVMVFIRDEIIVCGIDDTIERRKGEKIKTKGIYAARTRRSSSSTTGESSIRAPDKFSLKGSGLPIPSNGVLFAALISLLILLSVFRSCRCQYT